MKIKSFSLSLLILLMLVSTNKANEDDSKGDLSKNKEEECEVTSDGTVPDRCSAEDDDTSPKTQAKTHSSQDHGRRAGEEIEIGPMGEVTYLDSKMNVLLIQADQMRFDMIGAIQKMLPHYKGKLKVKTPNLDKLMKEGTTFTRHYTQSPICGPARTTMRTGCTIKRTGVGKNNQLVESIYTQNKKLFAKLKDLVGFDQVLTSDGYNCETYGKWHIPKILKFMKNDNSIRAIRYDRFDYEKGKSFASPTTQSVSTTYRPCLKAHEDQLRKEPKEGELMNPYSQYPYTPTKMDVRYDKPNGPSTHGDNIGKDSLSRDFTETSCVTTSVLSAMERLVKEGKPWLLDASYGPPHPPFIATPDFFNEYWDKRGNFFIPPSFDTAHMSCSAYKIDKDPDVQNVEKVKEWMVSYYALVEEVDYHIGRQLQLLEDLGQKDNTLVIFTSDHGESLGSHGQKGKFVFYDESARVPMIFSLPGIIPAGKTIDIPTSAIDLFSTIMDITGNSEFDVSDGKSLMRFMHDTNMNESYDSEVVIAERDNGSIAATSFMVVKGNYKLTLPGSASSKMLDQLFNLEDDPFEMSNLLCLSKLSNDPDVIGKAEHLKALLIEWMKRKDEPEMYFSDPVHTGGEGRGSITEISERRKWGKLPIWVSDTSLQIGKPVFKKGKYVRKEYIYLGRTSPGKLTVNNIKITGVDSQVFQIGGFTSGDIESGEYKRVVITFQSKERSIVKDAQILISHGEGEDKKIDIIGYDSPPSQICIDIDDDHYPNSVGKGTNIEPGEYVCFGDKKFGLTNEGKVVYMVGSDIAWKPKNSKEGRAAVMYMMKGGQITAFDDKNEPIWVSNWSSGDERVSSKVPDSRLYMTKAGAEIRGPEGDVTWELDINNTGDETCIKMDDEQYPNSVGKGTNFAPGEYLCFGDNKFGLTNEGKVVYMVGSDIVWEPSNSKESTAKSMYMMKGGQLTAFNDDMDAIWVSDWPSGDGYVASRVPDSRLYMTNTGAEIRTPGGEVTWRLKT